MRLFCGHGRVSFAVISCRRNENRHSVTALNNDILIIVIQQSPEIGIPITSYCSYLCLFCVKSTGMEHMEWLQMTFFPFGSCFFLLPSINNFVLTREGKRVGTEMLRLSPTVRLYFVTPSLLSAAFLFLLTCLHHIQPITPHRKWLLSVQM